jgi:hypothetical protein
MNRLWRVTGTDRHQVARTIKVRAADHNEAVRKGSQSPNCLGVRECVLLEDDPQGSQRKAIEAFARLQRAQLKQES